MELVCVDHSFWIEADRTIQKVRQVLRKIADSKI